MISVPPGFYNLTTRFGQPHTGQVVTTSSPVLIAAYNQQRLGITLTNAGTDTIYIGDKDSVNSNQGHALLVGNSILIMGPFELWGLAASATQLLTFIEGTIR